MVVYVDSKTGQTLHVYLKHGSHGTVTDIFRIFRPDVAIVDRNSISTLELTICHESNLHVYKSKRFKTDKYASLFEYCTEEYC